MRKLKVRVKSSDKTPLVLGLEGLFLVLALLPQFIYWSVPKNIVLNPAPFFITSFVGAWLFLTSTTLIYLFSRFSPINWLKTRKKLVLFTEMLTKQIPDGKFMYSVEWRYQVKNDKILVELFSSGLVPDKAGLGIQLSEYLRLKLLKREELSDKTRYTFGNYPKRLDGMEVLTNDR